MIADFLARAPRPDREQSLHLSRHTVKTHIGHLMAKLAARDRAQLVIAGYEAGLTD